MEFNRVLAVLALLSLLFASEHAFAARAKRQPLPQTPGNAYQNKPISTGATVWYCAYSGATEILCRLGDMGSSLGARVKQAIDPRLPKIVGDILNHPERLVRGQVSIPLHTVPFDFDMVGQLAEAVMCSDNSACGVIFGETADQLAVLVRQFEGSRLIAPSQLASSTSVTEQDGQK